MIKKSLKKISFGLSAAALSFLFFSNSSHKDTPNRSLSSVESVQEVTPVKVLKTKISKPEAKISSVTTPPLTAETSAPAPYFLNSDNFKQYDEILYKVVRSPAEKSAFSLSLLNHRSLEDAAKYLKSPSAKPGKEEKIYHLKASGFLIKAILTHPAEFNVAQAVSEVLNVNLSDAKSNLSAEAYTLLKENKAELMYHALAVSEDIKSSYSTLPEDKESQGLLKKINSLHSQNVAISQAMISNR